MVALVPTHRRDLRIEADIAEEIARVRGYETVPAALPVSESPPYRAEPRLAGQSVYITGYTPFDHTLVFEFL